MLRNMPLISLYFVYWCQYTKTLFRTVFSRDSNLTTTNVHLSFHPYARMWPYPNFNHQSSTINIDQKSSSIVVINCCHQLFYKFSRRSCKYMIIYREYLLYQVQFFFRWHRTYLWTLEYHHKCVTIHWKKGKNFHSFQGGKLTNLSFFCFSLFH